MCRVRSERAVLVDDAWLGVDLADADLDAIDELIAEGLFDSREDAVERFLVEGMRGQAGKVPQTVAPGGTAALDPVEPR